MSELINYSKVNEDDLSFVQGLELAVEEGDHLKANTELHGRIEVNVTSINFQPVIWYAIQGHRYAARVPGLSSELLPSRYDTSHRSKNRRFPYEVALLPDHLSHTRRRIAENPNRYYSSEDLPPTE